ncbi:potassium channel family protein [Corynebacterium comes]|uniref:Ion channel n=1 Tax=Corynebacterium comes TaxID=2675218 RepID=A0A6B8W1B0_9CORY|nr:potassium channel family protein [Corynebacterium comes]QGU05797.1 Ion channel [Corynebacterium comes]
MTVALTMAGFLVVALGLWDMFRSLLRPEGQGTLSGLVFSGVWEASKVIGHRFGSAVGPASMLIVILLWVLLQGIGWTLIYLPYTPEGFSYSSGIDPAKYPALAEAFYISLVTLSTLGFGDIVPADPWVRLVLPLEALTGFALLTAALTWFSQVHPPLSRRRALAMELKGMNDAGYARAIPGMEPSEVARVLDNVTGQVRHVCIDFFHYSETYYFQEGNDPVSLARQLPYVLELRDAARASQAPELRMSARRLSGAMEELSAELARNFVSGSREDPASTFAAYAADHDAANRP